MRFTRTPKPAEIDAMAEARLVQYLGSFDDRPHMQLGVTVDTILATHRVSRKVAEYRLTLARARWAR